MFFIYTLLFIMCFSFLLLLAAPYLSMSFRLRTCSKTLCRICFVALGIYAFFFTGSRSTYAIWLVAGLICSAIGDVALAFTNSENMDKDPTFIGGVAAFSLAHVAYIVAFLSDRKSVV